jgi:adenosylcobinamide kinase/adenosylcobinamide-phosphate guanylyltransferase
VDDRVASLYRRAENRADRAVLVLRRLLPKGLVMTVSALPRVDFVLGGARSGKTGVALARAEASGLSPVMVATAQAHDDEMAARIAAHRAERGPAWGLVEEPLALADVVAREAGAGRVLVVDCLTLWLSNVLFAERDVEAEIATLAAALERVGGAVILVSNEVGLGIVPENALARRFRDLQGRLNREVARVAERVTLVVAGLEVAVKQSGTR